jgi:hypothetical protein
MRAVTGCAPASLGRVYSPLSFAWEGDMVARRDLLLAAGGMLAARYSRGQALAVPQSVLLRADQVLE